MLIAPVDPLRENVEDEESYRVEDEFCDVLDEDEIDVGDFLLYEVDVDVVDICDGTDGSEALRDEVVCDVKDGLLVADILGDGIGTELYEVFAKFKFNDNPPVELALLFLAEGCILTFFLELVCEESGIDKLDRWNREIVCFGKSPLDEVTNIE